MLAVCVHIYMRVCVCMCGCRYMYAYVYVYRYMYMYAYVCMWPQVLSAAWAEEWALNTQAPFLNLTAALAQVRAPLDTQTCVHTQHMQINSCMPVRVRERNRFHV